MRLGFRGCNAYSSSALNRSRKGVHPSSSSCRCHVSRPQSPPTRKAIRLPSPRTQWSAGGYRCIACRLCFRRPSWLQQRARRGDRLEGTNLRPMVQVNTSRPRPCGRRQMARAYVDPPASPNLADPTYEERDSLMYSESLPHGSSCS